MDPNGIIRAKMGKESQFGKQFTIHWIVPWRDMFKEFLHTWESIKDRGIWTKVCGEKIIIEQVLISRQFNVSVEGVVDVANALVNETQTVFKNIMGLYAFVEKE